MKYKIQSMIQRPVNPREVKVVAQKVAALAPLKGTVSKCLFCKFWVDYNNSKHLIEVLF